ncbi:transcriptional regulator [Dietzia kunjamensis]|uniref:transcriptional regulator n=1 Tax=Dietzia kunjamensis TaxID=322509 RepID=UPI00388DF0FE
MPVDRIFRALADATRRDILRHMSFAAVRKHVNVLEEAGLITGHRIGRERRIRGDLRAIRGAQRLLDAYEDMWRARVDRLDALLAED